MRYWFGLALFCLAGSSVGVCSPPEEAAAKADIAKTDSIRGRIAVNNRVLACVGDQVITVYDVIKKLDMLFYRQFPEFRSSAEARVQFYTIHWKLILQDLIDRQLALAFADEKKFEVVRGDVRQEMEEMFGPDVMMNMYNAGLNIQEVESMLKADILMRRIIGHFVQAPVYSSLTPQKLQQLYQESLSDRSATEEEWLWQSVTIAPQEAEGEPLSEKAAEKVWQAIRTNTLSSALLKECRASVSESNVFTSKRSSLAPNMAELLGSVPVGELTAPSSVKMRADQSRSVWKCYRILEKQQKMIPVPPFSDVEAQLREEAAAPLIMERTRAFFSQLRDQYGLHMLLSDAELETFEPCRLRTSLQPSGE